MIGHNDNIENQATRIVSNIKQTSNDCLIKGMILKILNGADRPLRGREIFNHIQYDNYDSFRVLLSRYASKKYNYIEKIKHNSNSHYLYQISSIGQMHAANPFLHRDRYKARQAEQKQMFLFELLQNPEQLSSYINNMNNVQVRTVFDTMKEYVGSNLRDFGDEDDSHQSSSEDEINYEDKYFSSLEEVKKLKSQVFNLQLKLNKSSSQIPKASETKLPSASKDKRYDYLCSLEGKQLTSSFFENELIPYYVLVKIAKQDAIQKWKQKLSIDSKENVGIFSRTIAATLLKEGLYRKATAQEIKEAGLYLMRNRGIRVVSKKYKINKVVLKQSEIPAAASKNGPQSRTVINKNPK